MSNEPENYQSTAKVGKVFRIACPDCPECGPKCRELVARRGAYVTFFALWDWSACKACEQRRIDAIAYEAEQRGERIFSQIFGVLSGPEWQFAPPDFRV